MSKITYFETHAVEVLLDGRKIGTIKLESEAGGVGYRYYPKNSKFGSDLFETLAACQRSLEN